MSTHKNIDRVCIFITILAILVTVFFMNGTSIGIAADDSITMDYTDKIFDDSYVHTIDIQIDEDDWESLIANAASEEYSAADVVIDGETMKNVGIRCKGNTSLSTVSQLNSERYSFKIEFDAYESSNNYYGLDKLCLNNLIQDYTMMKDYLAYKLMGEFGVDAPLVSYTYITVNGEDWGLYLAVEAVEDSFLERNNGTNYGELYKPDTMTMGGGRGNGGDFDMKNMDFDKMGIPNPFENKDSDESGGSGESGESSDGDHSFGPGGSGGPGGSSGPGGFGGSGMGSSDAKLQYIDDDTDSYSTIFNSAKTTIKKSDKKRLINSLKSLNEGIENQDAEEIAEAVDIDKVLRYMIVHNFVVNGDSYTGSMIHNYYLYEEDGILSMIPWDYNLAYGTFQASDASGAVNDPIDTPLSVTEGSNDRPMFTWITSCDEYLEMYHEYFADFIEQFYTSGYMTDLIDTTYEMIRDYVDKDPTKFCTTEEFDKGIETLRSFVELRSQSIQGQLDGTIGSTDSEQESNPDALIDASSITLSDLGSMGGGMGGGPGGGPGNNSNGGSGSDSSSGFPGGDNSSGFPGGDSNGGPPDFSGMSAATISPTNLIYLAACGVSLLVAIFIALKYRTRR
ncbi:CotH kinase family protein [Butyrivibrio sp. INlla16]|uniref:CotH kinase family protein n=1 Tax=Butyrivibrio sp. INlla16 TaxID=1520807 RepID=UPI00088CD4C5|nr:CotH kinase family protein [Butyrivibrio sp. INlla16]SDB06101.1 CotH protein [Butyrivibrio sp. INlla16]